jgi:hypothetical protein
MYQQLYLASAYIALLPSDLWAWSERRITMEISVRHCWTTPSEPWKEPGPLACRCGNWPGSPESVTAPLDSTSRISRLSSTHWHSADSSNWELSSMASGHRGHTVRRPVGGVCPRLGRIRGRTSCSAEPDLHQHEPK